MPNSSNVAAAQRQAERLARMLVMAGSSRPDEPDNAAELPLDQLAGVRVNVGQSGMAPFDPWFDENIRKPDGSTYSKRSKQAFVKRFKIPVTRMGWARLVDVEAADQRLRELAAEQSTPATRRGRPRIFTG